MRFGLLAVGGWLVAAALTVGVSWSAISVVRQAVIAGPEVDSGLPAPEEPTPTTTATTTAGPTAGPTATATTPRPSPAPLAAVGSGRGGTAIVRCVDGRPAFVNVTPKQGYRVERDGSGDEVEFRSSAGRTKLTATCAGGVPQVRAEDRDDGGSGRGGDDD